MGMAGGGRGPRIGFDRRPLVKGPTLDRHLRRTELDIRRRQRDIQDQIDELDTGDGPDGGIPYEPSRFRIYLHRLSNPATVISAVDGSLIGALSPDTETGDGGERWPLTPAYGPYPTVARERGGSLWTVGGDGSTKVIADPSDLFIAQGGFAAAFYHQASDRYVYGARVDDDREYQRWLTFAPDGTPDVDVTYHWSDLGLGSEHVAPISAAYAPNGDVYILYGSAGQTTGTDYHQVWRYDGSSNPPGEYLFELPGQTTPRDFHVDPPSGNIFLHHSMDGNWEDRTLACISIPNGDLVWYRRNEDIANELGVGSDGFTTVRMARSHIVGAGEAVYFAESHGGIVAFDRVDGSFLGSFDYGGDEVFITSSPDHSVLYVVKDGEARAFLGWGGSGDPFGDELWHHTDWSDDGVRGVSAMWVDG